MGYDTSYGDGKGNINAHIDFSDVELNVLNTRVNNGTPGSAIKNVESLCVFIYRKVENNGSNGEESQYTLYRYVPKADLINFELENNNNYDTASDAVPDGTHQAEATDKSNPGNATPKAKFTIKNVDFGNYQIYAVANMGDNWLIEKYNNDYEALKADYNTPEQLKSIHLTWNEVDIPSNNQMFGYFTPMDNQQSVGFGDNFMVTVNSLNTELHSWLKRAASKVTVVVNGDELYPGVKVWIKSIQVKDVPEMCWLGRDNTAASSTLINQGEKIVVSDSEGADSNYAENLVANEVNFKNYPRNPELAHSENADALFFYENMQGQGQLKSQLWPNDMWPDDKVDSDKPMFPNGNDPTNEGYKDRKIAGTYVEVVGYYSYDGSGENPKHRPQSEGPIIYRFMLGKNITDNYDAQRNYHFKLTLKLKHYADDQDWHIVYNREPDILLDTPYYISYLYNESMSYPLKIVGGKLISLKTEIPDDEVTQRSWAPRHDEVTDEDKNAAAALVPPGGQTGGKPYWDGVVNNPGPWNGFLSVRKTKVAQFGSAVEFPTNAEKTYTENKKYYDENKRGERVYDVEPGKHIEEDGDYEIVRTAPDEYEVFLPFYTRARVMVAQTAYTGNNPFAAYNRESKVRITAVIEKSDRTRVTVTEDVQIIQSRRILNPKAVWRSADNADPFHVQLKILPYQQAPKFENLISDGPWRAEVAVGKEWIQLWPTGGASQLNPDGTISGTGDPYDPVGNSAGCTIDFTIKPTGTIPSGARGGIVRVYYNNYSCVHTIFVRQGYDPVSFYGSNVKWHTTNLRTGGYNNINAEEIPYPEVEGAYFRRYNRRYPISAMNNTKGWQFMNGIDRYFTINDQTSTIQWSDITTNETSWGTFKVSIRGEVVDSRLPNRSDWENIIGTSTDPRYSTVYGYGVLYADGANETLENIDWVYGATPEDHDSGRGMRGVIVCDDTSGTQIFLPTAATGYGRFKQLNPTNGNIYNRLPAGWGGVIQYANRYSWYPDTPYPWNGTTTAPDNPTQYAVQYHPLFYDMWSSEGAIYWLDGDYALDINFFTLDFAISTQSDLGLVWSNNPDPSGSDALHIRLVHDE